MIDQEAIESHTADQLKMSKHISVAFPGVEWFRIVRPAMKKGGYVSTNTWEQNRFFRDAIRHFVQHLAHQETAITNAGFKPDDAMLDELSQWLAQSEDDQEKARKKRAAETQKSRRAKKSLAIEP